MAITSGRVARINATGKGKWLRLRRCRRVVSRMKRITGTKPKILAGERERERERERGRPGAVTVARDVS